MRASISSLGRIVSPLLLVFLAAGAAWGQTVASQEKDGFTATLTGFQTSVGSSGLRFVTATLRFKSRSDKALILACQASKVSASDDQGNRYAGATVRGLGSIAGNAVDPKFALAPGAEADATFELRTRLSPTTVRGVTFSLDVAVREVATLPSGQLRLGAERALEFTGLKPETFAPSDGDASVDAGPFRATVLRTKVNRAVARRWTTVDLTVRLTNSSAKPLTLAYEQFSGYGIDDQGNRFSYGGPGSHDTSATGIGMATSSAIDPQFTLAPGESREVHLSVLRAPGREVAGTKMAYYADLVSVETLPSGQLRTTRQYSLAFPGLDIGR